MIIQVLCKFGLSCFVGNLLFLDRWEKFLDTQLVNFCFFLIFFCYFLSGFLYVGLFGWSEFSVLMLQVVKKSCFSEVGFWCRCWELAERVDVEWERKKVRWGWITWIVCVSSILCLRSGYLRLFQSPFLVFIFLMYWYIFQVFVFVDLLILDLKKKKKLEKAYDLSRYVATFVVDLEILCGLFKFSERVGFVNDKIRKIMLLFLV